MKKFILTITILLFAFPSVANEGMIEYQIKSELFMKRLIIGNINEAYDMLLLGSPLISNPENLKILNTTREENIKSK